MPTETPQWADDDAPDTERAPATLRATNEAPRCAPMLPPSGDLNEGGA
jgi:hypothetical protein